MQEWATTSMAASRPEWIVSPKRLREPEIDLPSLPQRLASLAHVRQGTAGTAQRRCLLDTGRVGRYG